MKLLEKLSDIWKGVNYPFLIHIGQELRFSEIASQNPIDLKEVKGGDVVAIVGDFNPSSILTLLRLIDLGAIVIPLTKETTNEVLLNRPRESTTNSGISMVRRNATTD